MALTAAVPYQHYTKVQGGLKVGAMVRGYLGAIPDHLRWVLAWLRLPG